MKRLAICPKCGSVDCAFTERGYRKCNGCGYKGRTPLFRLGGPKPKDKLDIRQQDVLQTVSGALWHRPMRYGDD